MIAKYRFELLCTANGTVRGLAGTELHGLLFNLVKRVDSCYSLELHAANENKPFAISFLNGLDISKNSFQECSAGVKYGFDLSALNSDMVKVIKQIAAIWDLLTFKLGSADFKGVGFSEILPPKSYGELITVASKTERIKFSFLTPTSFRQQGNQYLFPVPEKVFSGLLNRWNLFSPIKLAEEMDYNLLNVANYSLSTYLVGFRKYKIIGFVGDCTYELDLKQDNIDLNQISVLARFAEYAGVGYKTTMGMGQVRVKEE